jgi:uncharacterized protein YbaR (Trm112 family)
MNSELLKILVCPSCKTSLKQDGDSLYCTNPACRRKYSVKNDIPIMLIDESEILSESDFRRVMHP